jgi:hypothetical protein
MPTHDKPDHPLTGILQSAFASQLESGEVDLAADLSLLEFDVQADEWTLHLEGWPVTTGFVALDDEPATEREREAALDAALENQHMAALREVNRQLDNGLCAVLIESGDELSMVLAGVIGIDQGSDLLDSLDEAEHVADVLDDGDGDEL